MKYARDEAQQNMPNNKTQSNICVFFIPAIAGCLLYTQQLMTWDSVMISVIILFSSWAGNFADVSDAILQKIDGNTVNW